MMRQLALIASKEIRVAVRTPRFALAVLVIVPVLVTVAIINYHAIQLRYEAYSVSLKQQAEGFVAVKDYWRLLRSFITAFRPPNPKALIASGVMRHLDETFFMFNVNNPPDRRALLVRSSIGNIHSHWDLAGIAAIIVSLLSLVLAYDALCGERQDGTSQLLFSAPIRGSTVILGKIAGIFVTISIPIVLAILCALFAGFALAPELSSVLLAGLSLFCLMSMLLALVFVCLGVCISALARRPLNALALSLLLWLVLLFAVPQAVTLYASHAVPAPGQAEIDRRSSEFVNNYLAGFKQYTLEDSVESRLGFRRFWFELTRRYQEDLRGFSREINNRVRLQEEAVAGLSWLSPSFAWSFSMTRFCGTNPVSELENEEDVWRALFQYIDFAQTRVMPDLEESMRKGTPMRTYPGGIDWAGMPRPKFRSAEGPFDDAALLHALAVLTLWSLVLIAVNLLLVGRFDPR